jgi:sporulation protein YlmC with PRC-barrel domain
MSPDRVGDILGRPAYDLSGELIGRVADVVTEREADGRERVIALVVTRGRWGRLLGYERDEVVGPWLLESFARLVLRREMRQVPWGQVRLAGMK